MEQKARLTLDRIRELDRGEGVTRDQIMKSLKKGQRVEWEITEVLQFLGVKGHVSYKFVKDL